MNSARHKFSYYLLWFQFIYFFLTALWPLVHIYSFVYVSGPKCDVWLVKTVGALLLAVTVVFAIDIFRKEVSIQTKALAIASSFALLSIDCIYVFEGVIPMIYLADAIAEIFFIACWLLVLTKRRS